MYLSIFATDLFLGVYLNLGKKQVTKQPQFKVTDPLAFSGAFNCINDLHLLTE